jgi:hypothetical protein
LLVVAERTLDVELVLIAVTAGNRPAGRSQSDLGALRTPSTMALQRRTHQSQNSMSVLEN